LPITANGNEQSLRAQKLAEIASGYFTDSKETVIKNSMRDAAFVTRTGITYIMKHEII